MTNFKNQTTVAEFVPRTVSDLLDNLFNETVLNKPNVNKFIPRADILENEKSYEIQVAVPGIKKEDIKVDLEEGKLTISGERKGREEKETKKYRAVETQFGT